MIGLHLDPVLLYSTRDVLEDRGNPRHFATLTPWSGWASWPGCSVPAPRQRDSTAPASPPTPTCGHATAADLPVSHSTGSRPRPATRTSLNRPGESTSSNPRPYAASATETVRLSERPHLLRSSGAAARRRARAGGCVACAPCPGEVPSSAGPERWCSAQSEPSVGSTGFPNPRRDESVARVAKPDRVRISMLAGWRCDGLQT